MDKKNEEKISNKSVADAKKDSNYINKIERTSSEDLLRFGSDVPPTSTPNVQKKLGNRLYKQDDIFSISQYESPNSNWKEYIKRKCRCSPLMCLLRTIPVINWLPKYKWKKDILYDILSGITVAIMHIPQGMAYGILGNVPAVVGLYMAIVPVIIYFIFGTSRHISMGTFAIVCMMTGKTVSVYGSEEIQKNGSIQQINKTITGEDIYTNVEVATTVTMTVSFILFLMFLFRLGIITNLLSETLVNGFTCACAFHVVGSQLRDLLGLETTKRRGIFSLIYTIYDAILALPSANKSSVSISFVVIVLTVINNEILKPMLAKKTKIPFPIELLAVAVGTLISYLFDFHNKYSISIVGHIPTGMPPVTIPVFGLIPKILLDSLVIAIISYAVAMSMGITFANKDQYDIDANQELLAMGLANLAGSMLSCMPISASLSRSMIQYTVGGVTQLASIVSSLIIIMILLWIAPVFQTLPRSVLASIICVALSAMLLQFLSLPKFIKMSKWDGVIWLVTFLTTFIFAIDIGLAAGVVISVFSLLFQGQTPYTCLLGAVPNTELYLDISRYKGAVEIPGVKIFHYGGSLNFASKAIFKTLLYKTIGIKTDTGKLGKNKEANKGQNDVNGENGENGENGQITNIKCVIIDCSALTYVDPAGVAQLRYVYTSLKSYDIELYIAACSGPVYETFKKCDKCNNTETPFQIFPRIQDAVMYAKLVIFQRNSLGSQ